MEPIEMPAAVSRFRGAAGRMGHGPQGRIRPVFARADGEAMKRPALQGLATRFNSTFRYSDHFVFLQAGCLDATVHDGRRKALLIDHNDSLEVGSTDDGLEFATSLKGLGFRYPLSESKHAAMLSSMVGNGTRACVSVGLHYDDVEVREISGYKVEIVSRATILEISLCSLGAVDDTYAVVTDLNDQEPWLKIAMWDKDWEVEGFTATVTARCRRIASGLRSLAAAATP